jgi:hypothetical protein
MLVPPCTSIEAHIKAIDSVTPRMLRTISDTAVKNSRCSATLLTALFDPIPIIFLALDDDFANSSIDNDYLFKCTTKYRSNFGLIHRPLRLFL